MYLSQLSPFEVIKKDIALFRSMYGTTLLRSIYWKATGKKLRTKKYAGHTVLKHEDGNNAVKQAVASGTSFLFGRLGAAELGICQNELYKRLGFTTALDMEAIKKKANSGYYAEKEADVALFFEEITQAMKSCDMVGSFFGGGLPEDYYIRRFCSDDVQLTHGNIMDFWKFEEPFTFALASKKVLVVSPLAKLIEQQYQKRELIFENKRILPEFELKTLQAIQSIMGNKDPRADTWIDGVEFMYREAMKQDFEVALLGCGSYGMPLARRLKERGKCVIYMGGVLQMLFGIKGKRWDDMPEAAKLYNEHWVYPGHTYKPKNADQVEDGCYW